MRASTAFRALGPIDARAMARDPMLLWMFFLPLALGLLLRFAVPVVSEVLLRSYDFDLAPYAHLIVGYGLLILPPMLVGLVTGFLLLDERDDQTLTALLVTPLSLETYLLYRIGTPLVVCTAMTMLAVELSGLVAAPWLPLLPIILVASMEGPILALCLASFADNKVQGFAVMKAIGGVLGLPLLAWFVAWPTQLWAGLVPTYWPLRAYWSAGDADGIFFGALATGFVIHVALLWLLVRRFCTRMQR